ncbi:hypothetical protein CHUAL_011109 [Chamberlinius hualienensis]
MAERGAKNALYCCEICGQEGLDDDEMRSHMLIAHVEGAISCPFCDLSEITAEEMYQHVNSVHLDFLNGDEVSGNSDGIVNGNAVNWSSSPSSSSSAKRNSSKSADASGPGGGAVGYNNRNYSSKFLEPNSSSCAQSSKLSLNLKQGRFNGDLHSDVVINCPICGHSEFSPHRLEEHINRQHFDLSSPSFPSLSPTNEGIELFACPICARRYESGTDLELHVNVDHRDILSPPAGRVKGPSVKPALSDENSNQCCPVCGTTGFPNAETMALHIEEHFEQIRKPTLASPEIITELSGDRLLAQEIDRQEFEARKLQEQREYEMLKAQYGMDNQGSFKDQSITNMQRAVYAGEMSVADYYNRQMDLRASEISGVDDGYSCTKGLIPKIRTYSVNSNNVSNVWLCTTVDHYASTYGDKGWGCGYRNIQMMLSSLMHHTGYNEKLFMGKNVIPSISKLQELLELAWRTGFDRQGCEQLGGKLYNTRKWIGATEVVTFLSYFRIRCHLLDFHRATGVEGTHPELFQWVLEYFQKQEDFIAPLYLQHQGHSRTIVGVEQLKDGGHRLLIFDPSHSRTQMESFNNTLNAANNGMRLVRRPVTAMKAKQYQLVVVVGAMENDQEYQQSKLIRSVHIPKDRR